MKTLTKDDIRIISIKLQDLAKAENIISLDDISGNDFISVGGRKLYISRKYAKGIAK